MSIDANDELYQPDLSAEYGSYSPGGFADQFIRIERQTLWKMAVSGDILFTIRIHLDPLSALKRNPDATGPFIEQLRALNTAELGYNGMTDQREGLIEALDEIGKY